MVDRGTTTKQKKRSLPESKDSDDVSRTKRPRRAAACTDFKEKSFHFSKKSDTIMTKKPQIVEDEFVALQLTSLPSDVRRPNRRLTDFILHDSDGVSQPVEMLEVTDLFIGGVILPLEKCSDKEKSKGVRCESFGRVEDWHIAGFEDGSPAIWISTDSADFDCLKPHTCYKKFYDYFFQKACALVAVYEILSKSEKPVTSLNGLLDAVVRSMIGSKYFPSGAAAIRDFVIHQGEFIYNQLTGLDKTAKKHETRFAEIPVLVSLRDENSKLYKAVKMEGKLSNGALRIDGVSERYVKLLQDEEYKKSMKRPRKKRCNLPRRTLHSWALYNSDLQMISLELLPLTKDFENMDVTIFGSGVVTDDDGKWVSLHDTDSSMESGSESYDPDGMNIDLSPIKEWMIEFKKEGLLISISIRTDMAWYRLGKPSKGYAPWYEPVLKTARVGISVIALLKEQKRVAKASFGDIMKRLAAFEKNDKAYISSDIGSVERYLMVHGQIILQLFEFYPEEIKRSSFVTCLTSKMLQMQNTKRNIKKKKKIFQKDLNLSPRAGMAHVASQRKAMRATTTHLINRIWGQYCFIDSPDGSLEEIGAENEDEEVEEEDAEDTVPEPVQVQKSHIPKKICGNSVNMEIRWNGEILGKTSAGESLYRQALVGGGMVVVGGAVILETDHPDKTPAICFVEYMFENSDHCKMLHGRLLKRGSETVLGHAANERELFLTSECMTVQLKDLKGRVSFEIRSRPWGHQYRKDAITADNLDRARAEERKAKDLPIEYYCKSLYSPKRGGFFSLPLTDIGRGSGFCHSSKVRKDEEERSKVKLNDSKTGFFMNGIEYCAEDYVYVSPEFITKDGLKKDSRSSYMAGRNIGLRAFVVCQLLEIIPMGSKKAYLGSFDVKVRRFYRAEDVSDEKAYASDIQELYYSQETNVLPPKALEGKCEVRKKNDMPLHREYPISDHIFFCELLYDSSNGSLKQLPANMKLKFSTVKDDTILRKNKGKEVESEIDTGIGKPYEIPKDMRLATLDIFAGCGGLSQGLKMAGVCNTKWAIEYEEPAGQAYKKNHPDSTVFFDNCNVILRAIMEKCGDQDECISTKEANELAAKLNKGKKSSTLPLPGQVDFINGGPPCQGFSGLNKFKQNDWSKVQREMILAFLSFADYFRPRYFLLENVRNFVSFNEGKTFQLTVASLLEMGYQVRFGILEAGAYGVSQSRRRAFIWAAAPEEILPEWPEPMHVFATPELNISLSGGLCYAAVRSTKLGAPFRSITVRDTIGDLPLVESGESKTEKEYQSDPVSWFQKEIRGNMTALTDHICKVMKELQLIRCKKIPKRPGADWRDLPNEKVKLSNGQLEDLIPRRQTNTAKQNNQWKGLFGRLDWQGNFPTSITDPRPTGKVGMCFHPDQDRIVTVRECARSQGFPDSYVFAGNIKHKHKQIGNAVPPPLAFALGRKLKEALLLKNSLQHQS